MFHSCVIVILIIFILVTNSTVHNTLPSKQNHTIVLLDLKSNNNNNNNLPIHQFLSTIIQSIINKEDLSKQDHYIKTGSMIIIDCIVFHIKHKFQNELFNLIQKPIQQQTINDQLNQLYYSNCASINKKTNFYDINCNYLSFYQESINNNNDNNNNEINEYNEFPYSQIDIFRYTIHQVNNSFNGRWMCYSDNISSKIHNLIISDSQDPEVQSYVPLPIPSSTSVNVKCDYTLSSNVTNITELHKYNSNAHDQKFTNLTTITWELVVNSFDQPKRKRFTDPEVSKTKIDCQIAGQQQRRDKRQVDYDVYYPSRSVRLDTNLSPDYFVQVGTILEIKCTAEPGNPPPKLSLLRQRFDESKATVIQTKTRHLSQSNSIINIHKDIAQEFMVTLSEEDNGASFFCEVTSTGIKSSKVRSDSVRYNISFPPRAVYVQSYPEGLIAESSQKMFSCQTDSMGSNPPAILKWQQLDSAGAIISLESLKKSVNVDFITQSNGAVVTRSNLTVLATRALNGRRFECSVVFNDSKTLLRSEGFLEVMFSPNNIQLTAQPINGVPEAGRLELTCATSSCHPPAVIRWLEISPDQIKEKNKNIEEYLQYINLFSNELTDLAQLETNQGDFGGTKVLSTLIITKTYRSHQNTIYQCLVNHTGMNKPVLSEHRLQILYPPTIHIISLPNQPIARQSVTLFCQAIGGNPSNDLTYAWFVAKSTQFSSLLKQDDDTQLNDDPYEQDIDNSLNLSSLKNHFISSPLVTQRPEFDSMIQLSGYHDSQLNLTNIKLSQAGWYGCEVSGIGGSSHALYHLDLYYQPMMNRRTQTHVMAQLGESVTLTLYVDANPPWAEAEWFQIDTFKNEAEKIHNSQQYVEPQAYFEPQQINYGYPQSYNSWPRVKRTVFHRFQSHLSTSDFPGEQNLRQSIGQRKNIFASSGTGLYGNLTFFLRFTEVKSVDFGTYICQVRHQLGVKEFTFHLIKKAGDGVITEESIEVIHHGSTTSILFSPPLKSSLMKLILRVCRRDALLSNDKQTDKQSVIKQHFKRDIPHQKVSLTSRNVSKQNDITNLLDSSQISVNSRTVGCEDYQVAKPWLGKMEIHLSDAVQLYNFRFLLFQGTKLLQETSPVLWQPEISKTHGVFNKSLLALTATGGCALLIVFLIIIIIIYSCYGRNKHGLLKFWNIKKNLKSSTSQQSTKKLDVPNHTGCELGFELHSDLGSVRRYQPETPYKQPPPNGSFISHGYDNSLNGIHHFNSLQNSVINNGLDGNSIDNECAALLHSCNSVASSQSTHMNIINSRIFAEAYAAAARAAASVVSGSTDIYSPSSQMTNDLGSQNNEERNRSQHSLLYSMNQEINNGFINVSKETNINTENTGGWKKYNNSNSSINLKNQDKRKANDINKYKHSLQGIRKHSRISLSGQLEPRGSHLSIQLPSKHSLNYSQWSNASGASYSSLVSPSQTDLQVAAQVAAAAAVVSVVENMNLSLAMNHASSLNNVGGYCLMPRPSSRAASVTGPTTRNINKLWMENEDGESMKFGMFTPRNASTGQATPTASVDTVDPNLQISTPSPILQQQQYSNDVNNNNNRNQLSLNNQPINGSSISQYNAVPQTKLDDRYHQNYNPNRSADSQNISNLYAYQQQQMYPIHGSRLPYSTFISPTSQTNISSPSNLNGNEQNPSLMAYYRILAQNQMLNRHKLQQFHQHQLIQQQQHQRQHSKNDQLKQTLNMNKLHQQISESKNFISDQKDQKNNLEICIQPDQQIEPKKDLKSNQIDKIVNECIDNQLDTTNSHKFQDQNIQKNVNKHEENSPINQEDEHGRSLIKNSDLNETINLDNAQNNITKQVLTTEINTCHYKMTDQTSSNETPSLLLNDKQMINSTDINNENKPNNNNFNQPLTVTINSDPYYNSVENHNIYFKYNEHQSPPLNNTEYNVHNIDNNNNNCHINSSQKSQSSICSQNTPQSSTSPPLQSTQQSKQQPRLGIHSPVRTNRYLNTIEQSAFKQFNINQEKLNLSNETNIHSNSIA